MYKKILVPIDGSDVANHGLDHAIGLAKATGARLRLLNVITDVGWLFESATIGSYAVLTQELHEQGSKLLAAAAATVTDQGVVVETAKQEAVSSRPAHVIVDDATASGCDIIVMGTHGRKGVSRMLLGSDASFVVSISPMPVLLVGSKVP